MCLKINCDILKLMDSEEYRKKIERDILEIIESKLRTGQMNAERAREIARFVLESFRPHMTLDEIYKVAPTLDKHFKELIPVVLQVATDYEQKVKQIVIEHVDNLIKNGKIEESVSLLKNALNKKINVVK